MDKLKANRLNLIWALSKLYVEIRLHVILTRVRMEALKLSRE
jgi:hypothetical protein